MSSSTHSRSVTVLGGGIVGLCSALALQREGNHVTVIDRGRPGDGASFGHAGGIAVTWVSPQGLPGVVRRLPHWIIDPLGPVAVRWPYLPKLVPWFLALRRHSKEAEVERISASLASLMGETWGSWERVLMETGASELIRHDGSLSVYPDLAYMEKTDLIAWKLRNDHGFAWDRLSGTEVRKAEPALSRDYDFGILEPMAKWCEDPAALTQAIVRRLVDGGAEIVERHVTSLVCSNERVVGLRTTTGVVDVERLVIAAGAWSHRFARQLGHRVPLESERGYHVDLPNPGVIPTRILSLAPHKVVVTPMRKVVRVSGTAEFGGVDSAPDFRRARSLMVVAHAALPELVTDGYTEWSGHRPILPDSLPVVGIDPSFPNVVHAYGHSHIGFTLGPITGDLVADLVADRPPIVPVNAFRVNRFGHSDRG